MKNNDWLHSQVEKAKITAESMPQWQKEAVEQETFGYLGEVQVRDKEHDEKFEYLL